MQRLEPSIVSSFPINGIKIPVTNVLDVETKIQSAYVTDLSFDLRQEITYVLRFAEKGYFLINSIFVQVSYENMLCLPQEKSIDKDIKSNVAPITVVSPLKGVTKFPIVKLIFSSQIEFTHIANQQIVYIYSIFIYDQLEMLHNFDLPSM